MAALSHPAAGPGLAPGRGDGGTNPGAKSGGMGPPTRFPEQASYAAALGYGLGLALTRGLAPVLARLDLKMIVSPTLAALVFVGTLALCLGAALLSFRKVAALDPAIVFRG